MKDKIQKIIEDYGQLHEDNCELNHEGGSWDGCTCAVKNCADEIVEAVIEYLSHDIFRNEEQRNAGAKLYLEAYREK